MNARHATEQSPGEQSHPSPRGRSGSVPGGPITELPFDPFEVDALDDVELDALAHGAIALDAQGRILRYNLAEANLARLDRHSVLGRHFFEEVAPCTRTPEFEGAFLALVGGELVRVPRFAYLFDFQFGAQLCDVEMVKAPSADRYYVFVTRREFQEARSDLPSGWAAPLQAELLGIRGTEPGVLRDEAEQRALTVDADFLSTLLSLSREQKSFAWPQLLYEWGSRWGRRLVVGLEMRALAKEGEGLGELPLARTFELVRGRIAASGWGQLTLSTEYFADGFVSVELERSLLQELLEAGRLGESSSAGMLLEGMLGALFTFLSGRRLTAVELASPGPGRQCFAILGEAGRASVSVAVASGTLRTPTELAEFLRRSAGPASRSPA